MYGFNIFIYPLNMTKLLYARQIHTNAVQKLQNDMVNHADKYTISMSDGHSFLTNSLLSTIKVLSTT